MAPRRSQAPIVVLGGLCLVICIVDVLLLWGYCLYQKFALDLVLSLMVIILGYVYVTCEILSHATAPDLHSLTGLQGLRKRLNQLFFLVVLNLGFCVGSSIYILRQKWLYWEHAPEVLVGSSFVFVPALIFGIFVWDLQKKIWETIQSSRGQYQKGGKKLHGVANPAFYYQNAFAPVHQAKGPAPRPERRSSFPPTQDLRQAEYTPLERRDFTLPQPYRITRPKTYSTANAGSSSYY